jgi:hypothetical protein
MLLDKFDGIRLHLTLLFLITGHEITTKEIFGLLMIQWTPHNGITDNGINQLMGSNLAHLTIPK